MGILPLKIKKSAEKQLCLLAGLSSQSKRERRWVVQPGNRARPRDCGNQPVVDSGTGWGGGGITNHEETVCCQISVESYSTRT